MNLMKIATGALTPVLASKLAGTLGLPEGLVRKGLAVALPVVLAAFLKRGGTPDGAQAISAAMNSMPKDPLSTLGQMLGGSPDDARSLGRTGNDVLASILGQGQSASLAEKLAGYVGGNKDAVSTLLGVAGAGALGSMRKAADDQGLDVAGVMKLLSSQKDEIAAAIPTDFARNLSGMGLLPSDIQSAATSMASRAVPEPKGGGWFKWAIAAAVIALAVWLLPQFFGGGGDVAEVANPLVVEGTDIGQSVQGVLSSLTEALSGVTDAASAQSALAALTSADDTLGGLEAVIGGLGDEGRSALSGIVGGALPDLQATITRLLGNADIAAILKPVLDSIAARLGAMAT